MSRFDLDLVLPVRMEVECVWFWMEEDAASAVGAISRGAGMLLGAVRCFFLGWDCETSASSSLLEEDALASDSSLDMV